MSTFVRSFSLSNDQAKYDFSLAQNPDNNLYRISSIVSIAVRGNDGLGSRLFGLPHQEGFRWEHVRDLNKIILLPTNTTGCPVERSTVGDRTTMTNLFNFMFDYRHELTFNSVGDILTIQVPRK